MIWNCDPQLFSFLPIRWYGLLFGVGFLISLWLFDKMLHKQGNQFHQEIPNKFFLFAIIGVVSW
ncbi:prolipoprotein diacylglyceryl transferase family protein [Bacteroides sp.]|uniref:prolipoprotein diacylglyceryl transferase family protein n=1 Tax=Bacteroides sp. TaxID=29523 RepID=UPI001B5F9F96|nr:prolipoprotein diacylglyceryl transferase [Bacteroides sp.]MBP6067857.1 prolipoprotein diacylglyceryl transferase [Bacteroides sp.]MBP6936463.1 prolipoprotein diacylglyceryl transferase [Bacteroides sp.]MBP8622526.1 prolipoprotein diacylglyceryl transferase [Bacteroides sp.]MBP9587348.1 prolipoprotein diacylglyceryl transferase [Bacteroides sp.]